MPEDYHDRDGSEPPSASNRSYDSTSSATSSLHFPQGSPASRQLNRSISTTQIDSVRRSLRSGHSSPLATDLKRRLSFRNETQAQYMEQEQAYLHKLRNDLIDDYHGKQLSPVGQVDDTDQSVKDDEELEDEAIGLGGVGTSFDDPYTDLSTSYKFLQVDGMPGAKNSARLRERTEWQAMLTQVLTGEVFTSEKTRLKGSRTPNYHIGAEELWLELKAKVCGRTIPEEKQFLQASRSTVPSVMERVVNFKLTTSGYDDIMAPYNEVGELLSTVAKCEQLWHNNKAMAQDVPMFVREDIQLRLDALTAWHTMTSNILLELKLLQDWSGNEEADPTKPPRDDTSADAMPLVERIMKQDKALMSIFKNRIQSYMFPLLHRARQCTIDYADIFLELGLPLFHLYLEPVMAFPLKLIREIIQLRLQYARKLVNPTMVIIDQTILRFQTYMTLGLVLTEEYLELARPLLDKGWTFSRQDANGLNDTLLECITFYLELLINKFLDGGKTSLSFFRSFKSIEQLEQHYHFLQATCRLIEGGNISVAERFTSLHSRVLSRLLAYWEHQMEGPGNWTQIEIERWYAATIENIRSIQRKLLRFYKTLSDNHENAMDFAHPKTKMGEFISLLRDNGFFLVFVESLERQGIYTFASANLRESPHIIKSLLQGHSRMRESQEGDSSEPGCVLIFSIQEPLVWDGDIYHLDIPVENVYGIEQGKVRLVSQGGYEQLRHVCGKYELKDSLEVLRSRRSHLNKVDLELNRIRTLFYRLAMSVILSAKNLRIKIKPYKCQETVQNMFAFAREFGQRGLWTMDERKRGRVALNLIEMCVDWVSFVCDDCPPNAYKTFRWTVVALEFAMVMTRGINIVAITDDQFTNLRLKVANAITLLISHFDIMGARSKAADQSRTKHLPRQVSVVDLKDDDELIGLLRSGMRERLAQLDADRDARHMMGKVLDDTNTEFEILSFASSFSLTSMRWQQGRFIGSGAFGSVYEAQNLDTGQLMAVKEIRLQNLQSIGQVLKSIKDEMTVLEILSHPNVVQYFGVEVHRERVFIFMEYCEGGSLARLLEYGRIEDETVIQIYSLQMLEGLAYLHQSGIVHRDIKPENILLDHMGVIKFVDFGAAKVLASTSKTISGSSRRDAPSTRLDSLKGTPMYMSPEVITGRGSGRHGSMDIWSVGCCILEMCTGRRPWASLDNEWAIMYHIAANHVPQMPTDDQASPECQAFLLRTLERDPNKRPSAMELLADPWIVSIRNQLLGNINGDGHAAPLPAPQIQQNGRPLESLSEIEDSLEAPAEAEANAQIEDNLLHLDERRESLENIAEV